MSDTDHATWRPRANPWAIALVVTVAAFMEVLDTTIVNVSLPHIAGSLSGSYDDATWALTSYLVANGIVLPISGWLSDVFGRKRYFMLCIGMFTVCSLLCGTSQSLAELIIFRLLQGFFGGGLQPSQQAILLDTFPMSKRALAMAVVSIATIVAPILGPTLGGWITDNISWRWVFFLNVPVGIAGLFGVWALVEDPPWVRSRRSHGVDYIGIGLITLGLGALQITLDRGEESDWFGSPFIRVTALLAVFGILGAILWLLSSKRPVVNLFVLADRNFSLSVIMISVMSFLLMASSIVLPQFAQGVIGYTATQAGLILSPGGFVIILMIPLTARVMGLIETRWLVALGFTIIGMSMLYASHLVPQVSFAQLTVMRGYQTLGLAFLFVPISTIAYSTLPRQSSGDATALYSMFRNVAGSLGISLAIALISERTAIRQAHLSSSLSDLNPVYQGMVARYTQALQAMGHLAGEAHAMAIGQIYRQLQLQAAVMAYGDVFRISAVIAFAIVPFTIFYSRGRLSRGGAPGGH